MKKNSSLRLGLIQSHVTKDTEANLKKTIRMVERAAKRGAKIICLQELFRTIYFPQYEDADRDEFAETIPGASTLALTPIAKKYGVVIIVPVYEKDTKGEYHNAAAVIDHHGELLPTYHKIHIPYDPLFYEQHYFKPGDTGYRIYKTKYATFAVLICYDQWFPEAARMATLHGADLIFYPTAIGNMVGYRPPEGDWHEAWELMMRSHAIANTVTVAAVNRVGREDTLRFWGQSFVTDNFGQVKKRASATKEEVLIADVQLQSNKALRDAWGFFRNRRTDTYTLHQK